MQKRSFLEKETPRLGPLDFALRRAAGLWSVATRRTRQAGLRQILRHVNRAEGAWGALDQKSDAELHQIAADLRARLARLDRPTKETAGQAFALIREVSARVLGMRPYDVQLLGGYALLQGRLAEMNTGEGKTLTATLPAITAALGGWPVHVISVNDYLVQRDARIMGPLFDWFGLSVGCVISGMEPEDRQAAYACDVTYCTNTEVAFDHLKDRLKRVNLGRGLGRKLQQARTATVQDRPLMPGLCFAIIDEADSILIDEARTPLILSQETDSAVEAEIFSTALDLARGLRDGRDYRIDGASGPVRLTPEGQRRLRAAADRLGGAWRHDEQREDVAARALTALHVMRRGDQYVIRDDKIVIVDESTGRVMPDRFWSDGLHQLVELKEGVDLSPRKDTLAQMSYQRLFRRYLWLSGMTGTAREVAAEIHEVYGLRDVRIPPRRRKRLRHGRARLLPDQARKWQAVAAQVADCTEKGAPVLVGTRSVADSERLSAVLHGGGIAHEVINALDETRESEIVAKAGQRGAATIATNMAGRGTDIALGQGVANLGGLHVIMTERHASGRIDRQLAGRAARQGDPGAFNMVLCLDDVILQDAAMPMLRSIARLALGAGLERAALAMIALAQKTVEARHAAGRRRLFRSEGRQQDQLAFTGESE
ncbi:preprotein translocase subunit SecA [Pseudoprimorskyibacter insulae]|uniref:Protein translocase subunit SecA n=1 Tax=Pseudoprimorskyibacter insulae TaxID=1695997 RepID=A0A2R8AWI8_9RHOB|nr:prepilin peptidase [Pseudoprimorskyibacter insulae]SPF80287.1 Protein translocase subunit SecA [Pseudoprimorskyibacter insulae]